MIILYDKDKTELRKTQEKLVCTSGGLGNNRVEVGEEYSMGIYSIQVEEALESSQIAGGQKENIPRISSAIPKYINAEPIKKETINNEQNKPTIAIEGVDSTSNLALRKGPDQTNLIPKKFQTPAKLNATTSVVKPQKPTDLLASLDTNEKRTASRTKTRKINQALSSDSEDEDYVQINKVVQLKDQSTVKTSNSFKSPMLNSSVNDTRISKPTSFSNHSLTLTVTDRHLLKVMKVHQLEGANYILSVLTSDKHPLDNLNTVDGNEENERPNFISSRKRGIADVHGKAEQQKSWSEQSKWARVQQDYSDFSEEEYDENADSDYEFAADDSVDGRRVGKVMAPNSTLQIGDFKQQELRGVILADEMGLGKTLTTLAVVWTMIQAQQSKAVIVTPSSLVDNWQKEISKWFSFRLQPLVVKASNNSSSGGNEATALINTFSISPVKRYPLLIISYEVR
jgi:SNF2 family DNA or RNA helicase